jgi:hypothetical protein
MDKNSRRRSARQKRARWFALIPILLATAVCLNGTATIAQGPGDGPIAVTIVTASGVEWRPQVSHAGLTLTLSGPDDLSYYQEYEPGSVPTFEPVGPEGQRYPDGIYTYELRAAPVVDAETRAALAAARESGKSDAVVAGLRQAGVLPRHGWVQSGYFTIVDGAIVIGDGSEAQTSSDPGIIQDIVHSDDVIVDGSLCVGNDCYSGYAFGFDTIVLMENNLRVFFDDTSTIQNYPRNDWRIVINDSTDGGGNYFAVQDATDVSNVLVLEAGAPDNSLYVDSHGDVGINTSTPYYELHIVDGDSPAVRLEQDGSYGWQPQKWDLCGNESNFFIRDATHGSKLPFRIEPEAPTDSIFIKSDGSIGFGTGAPAYPVELERTGQDAAFVAQRTAGATAVLSAGANEVQLGSVTRHDLEFVVGDSPAMTLTVDGNLSLDGYLTELSDADAKENVRSVDGRDVLARLAELPISTWNYAAEEGAVRHMGPMAQDFYAAFALGPDERHIAPLDANGVALAAAQELYRVAQAQEAQIAQLERRNADLEARVASLEELIASLLQAQRE